MANGFRGEASFEADGTEYTLVYDANAFCEIEEALSTPDHQVGMQEILELVRGGMSMRAFRAVMAGGLRKHHQMSVEDAGELISEIGFATAAEHVGTALQRAMPAKGQAQGNAPSKRVKAGAGKQR